MKLIPNIELTDEQIKELTTLYRITKGSEAAICEGITNGTIAKIFTKHNEIIPCSDNKEKKIVELYNMQLDYSTIPVRTISYKGNIVGYEMTTNPYYDTYKDYSLTLQEERQLLLKTRQVLEYFKSKGIIYGDIELRNILFNRETGDVIFCDMDNVHLDKYPMDLRPSTLEHYYLSRDMDEGVHPYMHNLLTLRLHDLGPYSNYFELRRTFTKSAIPIIHSMKEPSDFINQYVIDHIKKLK